MRWAIQSTMIHEEHSRAVAEAVREIGADFVLADHRPFEDDFITPIEGTDLIPYGSTTLMKIAHARGWQGLAFDYEVFGCDVWQHYRDDMLNATGVKLTVEAAAAEFLNWIPAKPMFIRPNGDLKLFSGGVMTCEEIHKMLSTNSESFKPTDEIWFDHVRAVDAEWRCFIIEGNVVSTSMYRCEGRLQKRKEDSPPLKYQFQRMVEKWLPHKNCVMDIAMSWGEFKVIEFNCINSSGFYDHDIPLIVRALNRSYE